MDNRELHDFFDQSQDAIAIVGSDMRYEVANRTYCRCWGITRDQLLGAEVESIVGPETFDDCIRDFLARCLNGEDVAFERWMDFPGAGRRHMDARYTPRRNAAGKVTGVFLILRDTTDRLTLQAKIQSDRDKFSAILSTVNVGLIVYNRDLTIEWYNKQLRNMFPDGSLVGASCYDFFRKRTTPCDNCPALETLRTGQECSMEIFVPSSGRTFVHTTVPLCDASGRMEQVLGHVVDVTEERRSQAVAREGETRLNSIFRASRSGIGVVKDRVFTQVNDHLLELLGYTREELIGQNTRMVYASQEGFEMAGREIYGAMEGDGTVTIETQVVRKDGATLDALITVTFMDPDDPDAGATFVARDISDLKRAEKAVLESDLRFRNLFENVDMIAVQGYDESRRVVYWNPASVRLYGYTREEAMGQPLEDLIIPEPMAETVKSLHEAWVNGGQAIPAGELELVHKSGRPVPVYSCHVMQESPLGGKFMYCLDVDLAEIKRIHNSLVKAKEEAEAANMAKSEFLANMSHEIRTPLNGIQGMLSLLLMGPLEESQVEYAQAGIDSATRLNRLLSDILDFSRVEAGKLTLEKEMFNLPSLVQQIDALYRYSFEEKGLTFENHVASNIPEYVIGDSGRLQQVLTNLVGNGLKYTESGTVRLDVSLLQDDNSGALRVHFCVSDTGIGISEEDLKCLFEPFTQGSKGYTRLYQGAGLGLSICKRLVTLMGGNMAVESWPGEGSSFHVVIPFDQEEALPDPILVEGELHTTSAVSLNVLLAENDHVNSVVGQRMLEKAGCRVRVVRDGKQVLEALRSTGDYVAVFMDIHMPGMSCVDVTRSIRNGTVGDDNSDIPIFALAAYTMVGEREKFLDAGMDDYVPKPLEMEHIRHALRYAVEKKIESLN